MTSSAPSASSPLSPGAGHDTDADAATPSHGSGPGTQAPVDDAENDLRVRLGLTHLDERPTRRATILGWIIPGVVTLIAALLRLPFIGTPARLIFDETYYVKAGYSLMTMGFEGDWGDSEIANPAFADGDFQALTTEADYVVHPPLGKWIIGLGMWLLGPENPASWRLSVALAGLVMVFLVTRLATWLFRSALLGGMTGVFLAIDGQGISASLVGILDILMAVLVLAGFGFLLKDRQHTRATLAARAAPLIAAGERMVFAPKVGPRWWLVAAGLALGAATAVKWSGIYAVAVFGVVAFIWDTTARRTIGAEKWFLAGVWRGGFPAFFALVPTAAGAYVAGWVSWFLNPRSYNRTYVQDLRTAGEEVPRSWLPDIFNNFWDYHLRMWDFHTGLTNDHEAMAHPAQWLLQLEPTLLYRSGAGEREGLGRCGDDFCAAGIWSMGNILIWALAAAALIAVLYAAIRHRDWRAWAVLAGYLAMYVPWFTYPDRTIFQFYSIAFTPYVMLALTYGLAFILGLLRHPRGGRDPGGRRRLRSGRKSKAGRGGPWAWLGSANGDSWVRSAIADDARISVPTYTWIALAIVIVTTVAVTIFFFPVWVGLPLSEDAWEIRSLLGVQ